MKKALLVLAVLLLVLPSPGQGKKMASFSGHLTPNKLLVDDARLYVVEGAVISIYSLKDYRLIKRFGKAGEGPREFKGGLLVDVSSSRILVNSLNRVTFFSKQGEYLDEVNNIVTGQRFRLLENGKGFVGYNSLVDKQGKRFSTINLYGKDFKNTRELYRYKSIVRMGKGWYLFSKTYLNALPCGGNIFVIGGDGFVIDVFDRRGNRLTAIRQPYEPVKFTESHGKRVLALYKLRPTTAPEYDWWEKNIHFPDVFPAIRKFFTDNTLLYVRTYRKKGGKDEFFIFDAAGKLVRRVYLPIAPSTDKLAYPYLRDSAPFAFKDEKLYQLVENEEEETWELFVLDTAIT